MDNACKLWFPTISLSAIKRALPLEGIVKHQDGVISQAVLTNQGFLGRLSRSDSPFLPVKVGYWMANAEPGQERMVAGAYGKIQAGQHSIFTAGVMFTTYSSIDVEYQLRTRTIDRTIPGIERIEVCRPDRGLDLTGFVADAYAAYQILYSSRSLNERDRNLLFYASPSVLKLAEKLASTA